ncbi:MAG: YegS/Rv2252/BmrU family lipid kinase [Bacteroidaceae bacterium]|nr:YegS/Rv2252/BmrU family lipid kinase [Bacteroidaceae bacterium]
MNERKRIVFVVNPISGTNSKKTILKMIDSRLDQKQFEWEVRTTEYMGHATEIARTAANQGIDIVCAIGGDGTVNETARAIAHSETALAIIPAGSGNGLARHLHIPIDPQGAIRVLNACNLSSMDYGLINDHPFFCTCGMGFDAFISMKFAQAGKRGPLTYMENVLKNGLSYNPDTYEIYIDDQQQSEYKAFLISCANASQYGNNAYIAPRASVRDGLMDVTIIEPFTVIDAPQIAIQLFTGNLPDNSCIKMFRCKKLHVHRSRSGAIHYDGDPAETGTDIDIEIVPDGLKCISPQTEGMLDVGQNIQNFFLEHLNQIYQRSENVLQENLRRTQAIRRKNLQILRKLAKK